MKAILMRGFQGCGKTTWAKKNYPNALVICADNFFYKESVYQFDPTKLPAAHDWCLRRFLSATHRREPLIVVDNTNIRMFEIAPYYRIAECLCYDVEIVQFLANPATCTNTHNVPLPTVEHLAKSIEPIPHWWKVRYIVR